MRKQLDTLMGKAENTYYNSKYKSKQKSPDGSDLKKWLSVPLMGGFIYVISMFFRGLSANSLIKKRVKEVDKVRHEVRENTIREKKIRVFLNDVADSLKVQQLNIPKKDLSIFMKVLDEFSDISIIAGDGEDEYLLIVSGGELL